MHQLTRDGLLAVYAWADSEVLRHQPRCEASGKCCHFKDHGHRLYISHLEARHLLETAPAWRFPSDETGCPFQVEGLCGQRETRPLACRVYFCDPTFSQPMEEIMEEGVNRLKKLVESLGLSWDYAQLHSFLNDPKRAGIEQIRHLAPTKESNQCNLESTASTSSRLSLPLVS